MLLPGVIFLVGMLLFLLGEGLGAGWPVVLSLVAFALSALSGFALRVPALGIGALIVGGVVAGLHFGWL